jgi:6-phosphogluconate dehydrogenase
MLPSGEVTENMVSQLRDLLDPGDAIIAGGNSYFNVDVRRGNLAAV